MRHRKLVRLCIHDEIKSHWIAIEDRALNRETDWCSGGEFLPEGVLVIEKVDGEWPEWALRGVIEGLGARTAAGARKVLDALASQVGESE